MVAESSGATLSAAGSPGAWIDGLIGARGKISERPDKAGDAA